jgi:hypothetical protein
MSPEKGNMFHHDEPKYIPIVHNNLLSFGKENYSELLEMAFNFDRNALCALVLKSDEGYNSG